MKDVEERNLKLITELEELKRIRQLHDRESCLLMVLDLLVNNINDLRIKSLIDEFLS